MWKTSTFYNYYVVNVNYELNKIVRRNSTNKG